MREAIGRAREAGELPVSADVADSSGFRRRVARRIAPWMADGRAPDDLPPAIGAVETEIRRIYRRYQRVLGTLKGVDMAGMRAYYSSSYTLLRALPRSWGRVDRLILVEPPTEDRPVRLAIETMRQSVPRLGVGLIVDGDRARAESDAPAARFRDRLLAWGFIERRVEPPGGRPEGLDALGRSLFRIDAEAVDDARGLAIRGATTGEGLARLAASWIKGHLASGVPAEELLILVRSRDDQLEGAAATLRAWGLPIETGRGGSVASDAAVQALALAMAIPIEDWDTDRLGRLLRNGRVRPNWPEARSHPLALAAAAASVREARVYRRRDAIVQALDRMASEPEADLDAAGKPDYRRRQRQRLSWLAGLGRPIIGRLAASIDAVDRPGPWSEQVERLAALALELGIDPDREAAVGHLFGALDDHGMVLGGVGRGAESWTWSSFVDEVASIIRDLPPHDSAAPGSIRIATVDEAAGAPARHILLTQLAEGSFPDRSAVGPSAEPDDLDLLGPIEDDQEPDPPVSAAAQLRLGFEEATTAPARPTPFGREMARFLRVIGAAEESLTLAYPTADEKGVRKLEAGFVAEIRSLLTPEAALAVVSVDEKLDPALLETPPQSSAERRIRAFARAGIGDPSVLRVLAEDPSQRPMLRASAAAMLVNERRSRPPSWRRVRSTLGRFEGMLADPRIVGRLMEDFGPSYTFSASQLESLAFCPFQFFGRYVLRLDPIEERGELEEDRAAGGSRMHAALEALHIGLRDDPPGAGVTLDDAVADGIEQAVRAEIAREADPSSPVGRGLRAIEAERMVRAGLAYAEQYRHYAEAQGRGLTPDRFEYAFGTEAAGAGPPLVLGEGSAQVRLQGMVDRIDVAPHPSGLLFRVIDYKTGSTPSKSKLEKGLALQLPLYALAIERALPEADRPRALDAGYWALRGIGYAPLVAMAELRDGDLRPGRGWRPGPERVVAFVLELVDRLRSGMLPVHPAEPECERTCDYRAVCRIHQVRHAGKPWHEAPSMDRPDLVTEEQGQ